MSQSRFATTFTAFVLVALTVSLLPLASAHGVVRTLTIDSKSFPGASPGAKFLSASPVRQVTDASPVKGTSNPLINCGNGNPKAASKVADAMPGSVIGFDWSGGNDGSNWPHNAGPMITYLADCGSLGCEKFDSTKAKWFKIDQVGRTKKGGPWAQAALQSGAPALVTLPSTLAAGSYLIRHEIIALHLANAKGGAEFYPSCSQIKVGGTQSGVPTAAELVSFPGGYGDNDKGIFVPNVFDASEEYVFPGPKVAVLGGGSGGPVAAPVVAPVVAPASSSTASLSSSASAPKPTKSCKRSLKNRADIPVAHIDLDDLSALATTVEAPIVHSRVMRQHASRKTHTF